MLTTPLLASFQIKIVKYGHLVTIVDENCKDPPIAFPFHSFSGILTPSHSADIIWIRMYRTIVV